MRKQLYLLLLLTANIFTITANATAPAEASNAAKTILVFGDSLSAAYNIKREQGWVSLLQDFVDQQKLNIKVVNASISGETTSGGLERFASQLERSQPEVVILELGGNDGLRGFDLNTTRDNLTQMVTLSHKNGAKVLLAGIHLPPNMGRTYTRRFAEIYQQLASDQRVSLIPFILQDVATHNTLMQRDGIHPNAKGQPIIMRNVWQHLSPLIKE